MKKHLPHVVWRVLYTLFLLVLVHTSNAQTTSPRPFVTEWDIPWSNFTLPLYVSGEYDWHWELSTNPYRYGKGSGSDTLNLTNLPMGRVRVSLTPKGRTPLHGFHLARNYARVQQALRSVNQWGDVVWSRMDSMFYGASNLNSLPPSAPNLSNVTNMSYMFRGATSFNKPLNNWNVSNVKNMSYMFFGADSFNQPLNNWNVSNVMYMSYMFYRASSFNQPLESWNVSNVKNMSDMFRRASAFNRPLNNWDVSNVTNMSDMFDEASSFNQPLNNWNVSNVTNMSNMFRWATSFNQPLNNWNVSNVTNMSFMFYGASSFNQPLNNWNVGNVTNMSYMFYEASLFNKPLNNWNVGNVTNMSDMFYEASSFNQPLESWNVSNVTNMSYMFREATSFNQPLNNWNVGNVTNMSNMFSYASAFNQPLNNWNVSNVTNMSYMFYGASAFNQLLSNWTLRSDTTMNAMLDRSGIDCNNYSSTLLAWSTNPNTNTGIDFTGHSSKKHSGLPHIVSAVNKLQQDTITGGLGWNFSDGGSDAQCILSSTFITEWDIPSANYTLPLYVSGEYDWHWELSTDPNQYGMGSGSNTLSLTNLPMGRVRVSLTPKGSTPLHRFHLGRNTTAVRNALRSVNQWGDVVWSRMDSMFYAAINLNSLPPSAPNLSNVTDMSYMFRGATSFNKPLNNWDVSNVTIMSNVFREASAFNQPLDSWDVSNVTSMLSMFYGASSFNQPLESWNVSNVTNMSYMFREATSFNQPLNNWNVGNVTNMSNLLRGASAFNRPLNSWNVSSVTNMLSLFYGASSFDQPLESWNVGNVTNMSYMFYEASLFNKPLNNWNVGNVTNMSNMFYYASAFNQPLGNWNVGKVSNMSNMFRESSAFNRPLNSWNVSNVTTMANMFDGANSFNQDISSWNLTNANTMGGIFLNSGISCENYSNALIGWSQNPNTPTGVNLTNNTSVKHSAVNAVLDAYNHLSTPVSRGGLGWTIVDGGVDSNCLNTPLPIKLIFFEAIKNQHQVNLKWATSLEVNNAGFIIERSANGHEWFNIGFVNSLAADGNSNVVLNYQFLDHNPMMGKNLYRLKQIDLNGTIDYSPIRVVYFDQNISKVNYRVYPNPIQNILNIEGLITGDQIELYNQVGKVLLLQDDKVNHIDMSIYAQGVYLLVIRNMNNDSVTTLKIIKD